MTLNISGQVSIYWWTCGNFWTPCPSLPCCILWAENSSNLYYNHSATSRNICGPLSGARPVSPPEFRLPMVSGTGTATAHTTPVLSQDSRVCQHVMPCPFSTRPSKPGSVQLVSHSVSSPWTSIIRTGACVALTTLSFSAAQSTSHLSQYSQSFGLCSPVAIPPLTNDHLPCVLGEMGGGLEGMTL